MTIINKKIRQPSFMATLSSFIYLSVFKKLFKSYLTYILKINITKILSCIKKYILCAEYR